MQTSNRSLLSNISRILVFPALSLLLLGAAAAAGSKEAAPPKAGAEGLPVIQANDTATLGNRMGEKVIVEGVISHSSISKSGTVRYLNFGRDWRASISLVFFDRNGAPAYPPETLESFVGKKVRVTGVISQHKEAIQIIIDTIVQIEIVPEEPKDGAEKAETK